jgi:hypothetical protein
VCFNADFQDRTHQSVCVDKGVSFYRLVLHSSPELIGGGCTMAHQNRRSYCTMAHQNRGRKVMAHQNRYYCTMAHQNGGSTVTTHQNWGGLVSFRNLFVGSEGASSPTQPPCIVEGSFPAGGSRGGEGGYAHAGHDLGIPSAFPLPGAGGGVTCHVGCGQHGGCRGSRCIKCQQSPLRK